MSKRMLVAVDLSENSAGTLAYAYHIAQALDLVIDGLHVMESAATGRSLGHTSARELVNTLSRAEEQGAARELARIMSGIPEHRRGVAISEHGNPADAIVRVASPNNYEMVVVST